VTAAILLTPVAKVHADEHGVLVLKTENAFPDRLKNLADAFHLQGTDAVAEQIAADLENPERKAAWQGFVQSAKTTVISVKAHPNEKSALVWMNHRFERMGLGHLRFEAAFDANLPDPTALPDQKIRGKKWMRYLAGPGVAMAATLLNLPGQGPGATASDYLVLLIPTAGVGITTVLLELQFAWPYLNNKFWKHVWTFGGRIMGRVTNTVVNFAYGMTLWAAGAGAAQLPTLFGGSPIPFTQLPFLDAVVAAFVGGVTFHIAMGQFQTDISTEESRGSISSSQRYALETTGVVVNNSARVLDWVIPAGLGAYAQAAFFTLKTLPQLLKTNLADRLHDEKIKQTLSGEGQYRPSVMNRCGELLGSLQLINLPRLRK